MNHRAVALLLLLTAGCARPEASRLGEILAETRQELEAPGAILAVRYPDGTIERHASGLADLESGRPVAVDDPFQLGSVTKTMTAAVVLRLAEEGLLSIEDPLSRFLPDFPQADEIRLRHLLRQTSGLKDFYLWLYFRPERDQMIEAVTRDWSQDELIELAGRFGHRFAPGEDWDYSNANYFLLGVVIERASGRSLAAAYRHYLFDPLGLETTWLVLHEPPRAELPLIGYLGEVPGWPHSGMFGELGPSTVLERSSVEWGAGGVVSTAEEAVTFLSALLAGKLLGPASLERMVETVPAAALGVASSGGEGGGPGVPADLASEYGYGLARLRRPGYEVIGHGGLFAGHTAGLWRLRRCGVDVALYFNRGFVPSRRLLDRLAGPLGRHPSVTRSCLEEGSG